MLLVMRAPCFRDVQDLGHTGQHPPVALCAVARPADDHLVPDIGVNLAAMAVNARVDIQKEPCNQRKGAFIAQLFGHSSGPDHVGQHENALFMGGPLVTTQHKIA